MVKNYTPIDDLIKKQTSTSLSKETEPLLKKPEVLEIKEVVEKEVEDEIKPHVKIRPETIKIPSEIKKLGVQTVETPKFPQHQTIKLPLSDEKILIGLNQPPDSSIRWLATLAWYILKKAHIALKMVHGKIVRVFKK